MMTEDLPVAPTAMLARSSRMIRPAPRRARFHAMLAPMTPPPIITMSAVCIGHSSKSSGCSGMALPRHSWLRTNQQISIVVHPRVITGMDHGGRVEFFDYGGTGNDRACAEPVAVVNGAVHKAAAFGEIHLPRFAPRGRRVGILVFERVQFGFGDLAEGG